MTTHAIFQYNVLAIDDTHNTWTNMIVKMTILRLLDSSDDKEKISVARPEGPPLRWFQSWKDKNWRDREEIKSKRTRQRQFAITGWTDDRQIVLTGAMGSVETKSAECTGWTDNGKNEGVGAMDPEAEARI